MGALRGQAFTFIGRLAALPRRAAVAAVEDAGGRVRRGLSRRTDVAVIGHGAAPLIASGALGAKLRRARQLAVDCISEDTFLGAAGLAETPDVHRTIAEGALAEQAGLDGETIRLLALFDIVTIVDGHIAFRDLVAAKEVARVLADGTALGDIIAGAETLRGRGAGPRLAEVRLTKVGDGVIGLDVGGAIADLDGQMRLSLPEGGNPTLDDLYEAAETAEADGDWRGAVALYRRCLDLDRRDPTTPFNLANALRESGDSAQARLFLQRALALDPRFAEAWYNLSDIADRAGDAAAARGYMMKSVEADAGFADALYNLANLYFREQDFAHAAECWERYLALDQSSEWSDKARSGLAYCRGEMERRP